MNGLSNIKGIFEGELFIRSLSKTFLQIFFKCMLYLTVIFKSMSFICQWNKIIKKIFKSMTGPDRTGQVKV